MTLVCISTFKMLWFASVIVLGILAFAQTIFGAQVAKVYDRDPGPTCKDFQTQGDEDGDLDVDYFLGVWYEVENEPKSIICVDFELLTDQYREKLTDQLGEDRDTFEDYSLQLTRKCPGVTFNNSKEFHLWKKLDDKGQYKAAVVRNDTVNWGRHYNALAGKFSYQGQDYVGVIEVPTQRFITILSRFRDDYFEEEFLYNVYNCFCQLSKACLS